MSEREIVDRMVASLAERLYVAHQEWRRDISESEPLHPLWFALDGQYKQPYLDLARKLIGDTEHD